MTWHLIENTATGEMQAVEQVPDVLGPSEAMRGAIPDGVAPHFARWDGSAIVTDLDPLRQAAYARVKELREQRKGGGLMTPLGPIETDPDSRSNINGAVQMASILGTAFSIDWRLADNSVVSLNADTMIQIGLMVGQHVAACQYRKNQLDAQIEAAGTLAALDAIDLDEGWPS